MKTSLNDKALEVIKKHRELLAKDDFTIMAELDQQLPFLKDYADKHGSDKNFNAMAENFIDNVLRLADPDVALVYMKLALEDYGLPMVPTELRNFETFHIKYGNLILQYDANGLLKSL